METELKTLTEFIEKHELARSATRTQRPIDAPSVIGRLDRYGQWWRVTILKGDAHRPNNNPTLALDFYLGSVHKKRPSLEEVLDCLASDFGSLEDLDGFESMMVDENLTFGQNRHRIACATYQVASQRRCLENMVGAPSVETLIHNTARL